MWQSRDERSLGDGQIGVRTLLLAVLFWAISLTSLSFSFFTCKMGIMLLLLLLRLPFPFLSFSTPPPFSSFQGKGNLCEAPGPWGRRQKGGPS